MIRNIESRVEVLERRLPTADRPKFVTWEDAEPARREQETRMDLEQLHPELIIEREACLRAEGTPEFIIEIERDRRERYYAEKARNVSPDSFFY